MQLARAGSAASALTQTSAQAAISDSDPCSGAHPRSQDRGSRDPGRSKAVPTLAPVRAITGVCGRLGDLLRREWCRSSPIIATGRRFDLPPVRNSRTLETNVMGQRRGPALREERGLHDPRSCGRAPLSSNRAAFERSSRSRARKFSSCEPRTLLPRQSVEEEAHNTLAEAHRHAAEPMQSLQGSQAHRLR